MKTLETIEYKGYTIEVIDTGDAIEYQAVKNNVGRYSTLESIKNVIDRTEQQNFINQHFIIAKIK